MPLIFPSNTLSGGYTVDNSCRFNDGDSDYLDKTFASSGTSDKIFTTSVWLKRSELGAEQGIFTAGTSQREFIRFESDGTLTYRRAAGTTFQLTTSQVFRDPSAFYHIIIAVDTTQGTASNRVKFYVNGSQITSFGTETYPAQNYLPKIGGGQTYNIGRDSEQSTPYYDGYMAEFVFIDGQQLTPTSFGEFDSASPTIWKPIDVSELTFGTNGFYLDFEDSADLGADVSGNSNDFTVNNLTSVDQTTDTPTNNFCTMNPITMSSLAALAEGNLKVLAASASDNGNTQITFAPQVGKWYFECKLTIDSATYPRIGIAPIESVGRLLNANDGLIGVITGSAAQYANGDKYISGAQTADYGESYSTGDIMGIALDFDNGAFYTSKNNAWQGSSDPESGASKTNALFTWTAGAEEYIAGVTTYSTSSAAEMNFGGCQSFTISSGNADADGYGNFEYAPPSGYYALCTKNLAEYG